MMLVLSVASVMLAIAPTVQERGVVIPAQDIFYNRPGATRADLDTALVQCRAITTGLHGSNVEGRALTPPQGVLSRDLQTPTMTIEDCMVSRGWRLYALSPRESAAQAALSPAARNREAARLLTAKRPKYGCLVRKDDGLLLQDRAKIASGRDHSSR